MNNQGIFNFRRACQSDIPFIVDTIIEAEKSGTDILTYCTVFRLTVLETRTYLMKMLEEESSGCELSISSFFMTDYENNTVAAISAWVEGVNGIPSSIIKGNLLKYLLPVESLNYSKTVNPIVKELHIDYIPGTLQIGLVYVKDSFRGRNLSGFMINEVINLFKLRHKELKTACIQVFGNNLSAIKSYEKAGFTISKILSSSTSEIEKYMPSNEKILMIKKI